MSVIDFFQVDAFTDRIFSGNPAAVCPLPHWLPDALLQAITVEHNQSETAFFVSKRDGYELRWFTTADGEIDLCGHATLASAHVIFNHLNFSSPVIRFDTRFVGPLTVAKDGDWLTLDLPCWRPVVVDLPLQAVDGLGGHRPFESYKKRDFLFVFDSEQTVQAIRPNFKTLGALSERVCVTAPGDDCDFVSRFFCPGDALEEDPVTGSAHSMLVPYWAKRLNKHVFLARQISARGGVLRCGLKGERVSVSGQARTYSAGQIFLPD